MIRALVVENEKESAEVLTHYIQQFCPTVVVLKVVENVRDALLFLKDHRIDLLFLDVELDGATGFDLLKELPDIDFEIIFTTAHDKYALQAIKNSCLEYLLKPIDVRDLQQAVSKFESRRSNSHYKQQLDNLLFNLNQRSEAAKITIPTTQGFLFISVTELVICQADSNYTIIHTLSGEKHVSSKNLGEFEIMLPENFFRCHKSFLINIDMVKEFKRVDGNFAMMKNGQQVEVALRRKDDFLKRMRLG